MRILIDGIVFENDFQRGIQRYFYELVNRIGQTESIELVLQDSARVTLPHHCRITYPRERFRVRPDSLRQRLWRRFQPSPVANSTDRPDVFHSTYFTSSPVANIAEVVTVHDMIPEVSPHLCKGWAAEFIPRKRKTLHDAALIIAISQTTAEDIVKVYPEMRSKVRVVYHGTDHLPSAADSTQKKSDSAENVKEFALFVGDRSQYKNFSAVLAAMNEPTWPSGLELMVVGPPLEANEEADLKKRGLWGKIRSLGRVSDAELASLYQDCVAFVFPSLAEGFGFPLLEAQGMGAPVVCADTPIFREVAAGSACFFRTDNPGTIGEALHDLLQPGRRTEIQRKGRANVQRFSWQKCANETMSVYREVEGRGL